jgi:aryl-alcohol dehydrogenase-like predicted oxidoreductase
MASVHTADFHGHRVSQLVVGTVQFGMVYGVANQTGQPTDDHVTAMVTRALAQGVNAFDTASMYGTSEEMLGRAFAAAGVVDDVFVVSKVPEIVGQTAGERANFVERSVADSLARLHLPKLPLCLLHRYANLPEFELLLQLRERGMIEHAGVSVYTPEEARVAIATPGVSAVQIQTSVLDQRFIRAGIFALAQERGVALFVRSIFIQGLLTMEEQDVPEHVRDTIPVTRELRRLAGEEGIVSYALRYVASLEGVTGAVVGMETIEQLEANIAIVNRGPLPAATLAAIDKAVPELPNHLCNSGEWRWEQPYVWQPAAPPVPPATQP